MLKWLVKKVNNRKGFTLIELIVVIAILGILAAIAIPRLSGSRDKAAAAADAASIRTIQSAISIAEADGKINLAQNAPTAPTAASIKNALELDYLTAIPKSQTGTGWTVTIGGGPSASPAGQYTVSIVATTSGTATWGN